MQTFPLNVRQVCLFGFFFFLIFCDIVQMVCTGIRIPQSRMLKKVLFWCRNSFIC